MASFSSTSYDEKNMNRSDPSRMYNIGQAPLARLRPDKVDDMTIKNQISMIQEICSDIDPDLIALVHHECDYNMQTTIAKLKAGDYEDGGWQKAKSNYKKKNHTTINPGEQIVNGSTQCDNERSLSQRTSPTSSIRGGAGVATVVGGRHRQEPYQYPSSSRANSGRRDGPDLNRNQSIPRNSRYPSRNYSTNNKPLSTQANPSEPIPSSKQKVETIPTSSPPDEYEFVGGTAQSLTFDNSLKTLSSSSSTKRPIPSTIPPQPVSMHPTVHFSTAPIDIQFGDIQWNDSVPMTVTPSNSSVLAKSLDHQQPSSVVNTNDYQQEAAVQNRLSSSYINHQTTNETDRELLETTNRLSTSSLSSSLPMTNNLTTNNLAAVPVEETSHLSDHLANSLQQQASLQMTSSSTSLTELTRLPPTSTPNALEYSSPTALNNNPFITNILQPSLSNTSNGPVGNSSAFTPYNTTGIFQPTTRDFSQTTSAWNQQPPNYKTTAKSTMIQPGNYPQQASYQLPPQQPFMVGTYPYPTTTLYPVMTTPVESWSTAGYDPYSTYPTTNFIPAYVGPQQYHSAAVQATKYDQYSYDKEFLAHYGQLRLSNNELTNSSQTAKDIPMSSKLSATAATFSQGPPLTASNPATAVYLNPFLYTVPSYYTSNQDRSVPYPFVDNRDNRNGASYGGHNNRNHYHHQQQQHQRTHNNSTWHAQQ